MKLQILTPDSLLYNAEASEVIFPGVGGQFTVMENHIPFISLLKKGELRVKLTNGEHVFEIENGVMEMNNNNVTVCVNG